MINFAMDDCSLSSLIQSPNGGAQWSAEEVK